ncbi:histone acetylase complex subunit [Cordyceps javanica]|uniref:Chromatin modification-related protein EAF3 n=1 Tax=Cordyceps javanica TaxID=43265 RepID=A0A545VVJ2_9HYPO|nr:histone acetylase complex subunit [Cordyceps javanica]TQW05735.1 histone acetylase complex subunit [Cordyceps javanica]
MAPARNPPSQFSKDEKVLCFHMDMLYEAKVTDVQPAEKQGDGWRYKVHYKGWKSTWDDWVLADRIRPFDDEHRELAAQLHAQLRQSMAKNSGGGGSKQHGPGGGGGAGGGGGSGGGGRKGLRGGAGGADASGRGSEERGGSAAAGFGGGRGAGGGRRGKDWELETEDAFHAKPMINIPVPDHIQAMLVDDWENITKNNQLVPLPHTKPVAKIFEDYLAFERPHREEGSASMDILDEVIAGFREYFEKSLSRILLYRFERHQYMDIRKLWDNPEENAEYKNVCDVYGAEHLARLVVSLPELLAQTNMDQQSVSRLREEIGKFTVWLGRNCEHYFVNEYETPSQEYIDKARSF